MSASLFVKDAAASRFVAGGLAEAEALFGSPLPALPALERDGDRRVYLVHTHARLRSLLRRYLGGLLAQIGIAGVARGPDPSRDLTEYEEVLAQVLRAVRAADRSQGLLNLFWLAHSREAAEHLRGLEDQVPALAWGKLSLFPLLQSFYRRMDEASRVPSAGEPAVAVAAENPSLVHALIDDGFAFTEVSVEGLDLATFLRGNKRYRIVPEVFQEIQTVLVGDAERRLREGDRGLLARASRHLPGLPREHYLKPGSLAKIVLSEPILSYLLADPFGAGSRLAASPRLRAVAERGRSGETFAALLELAAGLRRFEIVSHIRERVTSLGTSSATRDLEEKTSRGLRVYEFGESAQVLNQAVPATILFLDLRGFTRTAEGHISERDLTRELYAVFDAFVPIIERFGGTVDKYLGDGMMVTWGTGRVDELDPLNAVRSAVLCQASLGRSREDGRTWFKMGIAIHHGRVYLARFIAGEGTVQPTVIGRNVNLAGRLSSADRRRLMDDGEELVEVENPGDLAEIEATEDSAASPGRRVTVNRDGTLLNEGIAISRATLMELETHLALVHTDRGMEYEDEVIDRRLIIRYVGDARFKGVQSSIPVYAVDDEARG
jgi:class 3 adenylate cyclase